MTLAEALTRLENETDCAQCGNPRRAKWHQPVAECAYCGAPHDHHEHQLPEYARVIVETLKMILLTPT